MSAVLFYDPVCQQPYDTRTLAERALGGTEATLVRVADALGACVMQHNRDSDWQRYHRPQRLPGVTAVVVNRDARALADVLELYPQARLYLWLHDRLRPGSRRARWLAECAPLLRQLEVTAVCVSQWHREQVAATLEGLGLAEQVRTVAIYNPVDEALRPDGGAIDERTLVFFSSPNKGLGFTLDAFAAVRRALPDMRLLIANPGYKRDPAVRRAGVELLGAQPAARVHQEVRAALCTLCLNFVIPETFGLVFAESHALGTPVLAYDCGAAAEVIADQQQLLPVTRGERLYEAVAGPLAPRWRAAPARLAAATGLFDAPIERIRAWRQGARPQAAPDARFRLPAVTAQWRELLGQ